MPNAVEESYFPIAILDTGFVNPKEYVVEYPEDLPRSFIVLETRVGTMKDKQDGE